MKGFPRIGFILGIGPPIIIFIVTTLFPSLYMGLENKTYDLRQYIRNPPEQMRESIVLVDIDKKSIEELGEANTWPRHYHAQITEYLKPCKVLGFYLPFFHPELYQYKKLGKDFKGFDEEFVEAVRTHGRVHLVFKLSEKRKKEELPFSIFPFVPGPLKKGERKFPIPKCIESIGYTTPIDSLLEIAAGIGFGDLFSDPDGKSRIQPLLVKIGKNFYPSFALSVVMEYLKISKIDIPSANLVEIKGRKFELEPEIRLRFLSSPKGLHRVSYVDLLRHQIPQKEFAGKIVLVGSSVEDLEGLPKNGVADEAMIIGSMISGNYIKVLGRIVALIISGLLGLSLVFVILRYPSHIGGVYVGALFIAYSIIAWWLFSGQGIWIEVITPFYSFIAIGAIGFIYKYHTEGREKRRMFEILSRHLPNRAVENMVKSYSAKGFPVAISPLTIMAVEIKNLDILIDKSADGALLIFNEFIERLLSIVFEYNGTLIGYSASGFTASFGAPIPLREHILVACQVAIELRREFSLLRARWEFEERGPVKLGIAITAGKGFVGIFGLEAHRRDLMVAGEAVDLAMRMASLNRELSSTIIISDKIFQAMTDKAKVKDLEDIYITHCGEKVKIYELLRVGNEIQSKLRYI